MGNKLGKRRPVVDEKYTKPQGLYAHKDVDHKKLKKLILESKLAPCYPGDEDYRSECEECPICFLYYPSLNRSRCCMKGICTECFLQMKNPNSTRPTQCPFCKTSNYAVEYRGVKTTEEKGLEQIEEQRVIEAKIRMRQQELEDEEKKMQQKMEPYSLNADLNHQEIECSDSAATCHRSCDAEESISVQCSYKRPAYSSANREDEFDIDLEDIMVMEAIWLSIQQNGKHRSFPEEYGSETRYGVPAAVGCSSSPAPSPSPSPSPLPSGGFACAIAALAERQQTAGDPNGNAFGGRMYPETNALYNVVDSDVTCQMARGWLGNDVVTGYSSMTELTAPPPPADDVAFPECFEDQMMLAMAVSLAEARGASSSSWDR